MGLLHYANASTAITLDDHLLAHIRTVAITKLRRGESFSLTVPTSTGSIETLWIHASIPLRFEMQSEGELDRDLLVAMMEIASASGGLNVQHERIVAHLPSGSQLHAVAA